jgi:integrase
MRKPTYRKHSTRNLGFAEREGKRHYFPGEYGSQESRAAYHLFLESLKPIQRAPQPDYPRIVRPDKNQVSVADLCFQFLAYAEKHYPQDVDGTPEFVKCKGVIERLVRKYGMLPAKNFGPLRLKEFQAESITLGHSRRYINSQANRVRRIFKWGVSEELVDVEVWQGLVSVNGLRQGRTEAREVPKRQPVSWDLVERTIDELSPTIARMVELQWVTGVRPQAICAATFDQFDLKEKIWLPKNKMAYRGQVLRLPIGPRAIKLIKEQRAASPTSKFLFCPITACVRNNLRYGLRYNANSYRQAVQRAQERANVEPRWSPHQLRHGRATEVRDKFGLEAAQAVLGHASIDATQIYASKLFELARRVSEETG